MQQKVSIIIPVIRPEKAQRCIEAIKANAGYDNYEIITLEDTEHIGCPLMVKKLVDLTTGEFVMFLGDDTIPQPNFLAAALESIQIFDDCIGLVALNDGTNRRSLATHWLASKKLLPLIGGEFFHTGYSHCYCDNELSLRTQLLDKYVYCEDSKIEHDNPILDKKKELDEHYIRAYSKSEQDKELFEQRKREILAEYKFTGERVIPANMPENDYTVKQHIARYNWAKQWTQGKNVVDAACGTGYGSTILEAKEYLGLDVALSTIIFATNLYGNDKTFFYPADLNEEFFYRQPDSIVTSFETIEHLQTPENFLSNVAKSGFTFIFSIPVNNQSKYHLHSWKVDEIKDMMEKYFKVQWYYQNNTEIKQGFIDAQFLLGVANSK